MDNFELTHASVVRYAGRLYLTYKWTDSEKWVHVLLH